MVRQASTPSEERRVVIMGCGRLGATIATSLAERGHRVHILDLHPAAFDRLPKDPQEEGVIRPILGDGTTQAGLRRAALQEADVFIAAAGRDTCNALAAQMAKHIFEVPTVICRMNDPVRQRMYADLGLVTISPTQLVTAMVLEATGG